MCCTLYVCSISLLQHITIFPLGVGGAGRAGPSEIGNAFGPAPPHTCPSLARIPPVYPRLPPLATHASVAPLHHRVFFCTPTRAVS